MTAFDIPMDGMTRVFYVAAISNEAAPTVAELNAGLNLTSLITKSGLKGFKAATGDIDNSALDSTFDTVTIGRDKFSGTMLELKKQSGTDTTFATLVRGTTGYIVIRRYVLTGTAWTAAQKCNVYPIICGQTGEHDPEAETLGLYDVETKITASPTLRATVA